jgi:predicted Zn-dependent protease
MRLFSLCAACLALAACGGTTPAAKKPDPAPLPPGSVPIAKGTDLPQVPTKIETTTQDPVSGNDPSARSPLLDVMLSENQRWMRAFASQPEPAYYLGYQITDQRLVTLEAEGGAIVTDSDDTDRQLDVEVRVGSPELDNSHPISDDQNDRMAVGRHLWLETDRRYREAVTALAYVKADQATLQKKKTAPDFSAEPTEIYIGKPAKLEYDKNAWVARLKRCSERAYRGVATRGTCSVVFSLNTVYFVNSEGTQIQQSWTNAQLSVSVGVKADDGMNLSRLEQRFGVAPKDLPDDAEVDKMIKVVTDDLDALHDAPIAEPYVGPAILEGRAAGVFFHEVFGHRIEGHRQKDETSGQTFSSYVGKQIMPDWLSVYDDPTIATLNGMQMNGLYRFDDEGVRARHVPLVDDGKLVGFEMGRNPIEGFPHSNGHGRRQPGLEPVSRQGNLVVTASRTVEKPELEKMLIEEIKRQGRPYGMIFTDISGGFTNTSTFAPQAFKVNPVMAYRLYPDGHRELVRGVDISGTPLVALQSIRAASRQIESFNGVCGAESGWVPVSASAPSLLIEKVETEKAFTPPDRPPVLAPPSIKAGGVR